LLLASPAAWELHPLPCAAAALGPHAPKDSADVISAEPGDVS
jgi:hypothetical protein